MKFAYHAHHYTLLRFQQAKTLEEKQQLTFSYFLNEAAVVDEEMKAAINRIDELEKRIRELEG